MLIRRAPDIRPSDITDETIYLRRREFLQAAAVPALAAVAGEGGRPLLAAQARQTGDNAGMIALVGAWRLRRGEVSPPELDAVASLEASGLASG